MKFGLIGTVSVSNYILISAIRKNKNTNHILKLIQKKKNLLNFTTVSEYSAIDEQVIKYDFHEIDFKYGY